MRTSPRAAEQKRLGDAERQLRHEELRQVLHRDLHGVFEQLSTSRCDPIIGRFDPRPSRSGARLDIDLDGDLAPDFDTGSVAGEN
jgi:hypothetical protein